ncbi:MAG: AraC family transcriptional regulator, partial [Bacteroidia bacterium]|nr:AraC family transcriptional regulator [Bacteroidia bacterium]
MEQDFLKKLTEITEANLSNPQFGVDELSREMGMSRSSLFRKLHASTQKPVSQFIREIRLWRALELMQQEGMTASEVSYKTGFSSPAYFNNCFHEYFGYPPGEARKVVKDVKDVKSENKEGRERGLKWKKRTGRIAFGISSGIILVVF